MNFYSSSFGIVRNKQICQLLNTSRIHSLRSLARDNNGVAIGWGFKPNTFKARELANQSGRPYWALEDGFISWLSHPTQSKPYDRLSYVVDKKGIYYDASKPSGLDGIINETLNFDEARVNRLLQQLIKLKVSKYNQTRQVFPSWLNEICADPKKEVILLVDQTFEDASISLSGADSTSFVRMLTWAMDHLHVNNHAHLVIKVHPDVILGRKKGYLFNLVKPKLKGRFSSRIHLLAEDVSPAVLISKSDHVVTVSSQLGFEALWQKKLVTCFSWPFYAGRGLTQDLSSAPLKYNRESVSLQKLLYAALIEYPTYLHPNTNAVCELEDILDYLQGHLLTRDLQIDHLYVPNVSLWKRSFIPEFIAASASKISFGKCLNNQDKQLFWGMKSPSEASWRIEDGFIRSVGLGADLRRPNSLVVDDLGIYYNGKKASRLECLLQDYTLNEYEQSRAEKLVRLVIHSEVTKYNVDILSNVDWVQKAAGNKQVILVVGQFQQDLSMQFGAEKIRDNMALLKQVRSDFPNDYIIYKEHPDVYSGVRPGKLEEADVLQFASVYVTNESITGLFKVVDRVCTICSLSGFEALLRGVKVNTYGLPFYGGWGLTDDHCKFTRRTQIRSLNELAYITLVLYARYVDWNSRSITTPEVVIRQLICERRHTVQLNSHWFTRQCRKLSYLAQALSKRSGLRFGSSK